MLVEGGLPRCGSADLIQKSSAFFCCPTFCCGIPETEPPPSTLLGLNSSRLNTRAGGGKA